MNHELSKHEATLNQHEFLFGICEFLVCVFGDFYFQSTVYISRFRKFYLRGLHIMRAGMYQESYIEHSILKF